tara:strand:- start:587 stop:3031 length:2445 start_codon:yes stop_codon:yes gene_type:complete
MKFNLILTLIFTLVFGSLYSQEWLLNFKFTEPIRAAENDFGNSVSTYNNLAAFGSSSTNVEALENAGKVYLAKADCNGWTIYQEISSPEPQNYCYFGRKVFLKENTLLISGCDPQNRGAVVYVYEKDANDSFIYKQKLVSPFDIENEGFGYQFDLAGNNMVITAINRSVVGSSYHDLYPLTQGVAYIYHKDNTGNWLYAQRIAASDGKPQAHFGVSVEMDGDDLVIGAPREGNIAGAAYVFNKNPLTNLWYEVDKLVAYDHRGNQTKFGNNVRIDNGTIAVSSGQDPNYPYDNLIPNVANGTGAVYIFKKIENQWFPHQKLTVTDSLSEELYFGNGLDLYNDQIAVGGQDKFYDPTGSLSAIYGRVYMFKRDVDGLWKEYQMIMPKLNYTSTYGGNISIHQENMFVSAKWDSYDSEDSNFIASAGSVYLYNTYQFQQTQKPVLNTIPIIYACNDSGDGFSIFNLADIEEKLTENVDQYNFIYKDINGYQIEAPLTETYANFIPYMENIKVRVEHKNNPNCYEETQIVLQTYPPIELNEISGLNSCDESGTGHAFFDLSNLSMAIVENTNQYEISYFNSVGANITEYIQEPYQNSVKYLEEIQIQIVDKNTLCSKELYLPLNVITTMAYEIPTIRSCQSETSDKVIFDTSNINSQILKGQTNKIITYYDAEGNILESPLPNPLSMDFNTIKIIKVLVEDITFGCSVENTIVFDSYFCSKSPETPLEIPSLTIRNFFTPNEDGAYDTWQPYELVSVVIQDFRTYIFNRYGKLITTLEKQSSWNGMYNGKRMPEDDYWYRIVNQDGTSITGHFSLKR